MKTPPELLSGAAVGTFKLNGQFLAVAEELARPAGVTATHWQVLGAVLHQPRTVAGVAREMGITRQSVLRTANLLVERGLAEYLPNPAHRTAKLVRPTAGGYAAVQRINPGHADLARRLVGVLGVEQLERAVDAIALLSSALDVLAAEGPVGAPAGVLVE